MSWQQYSSLSSLATDPLRNFKFMVVFHPAAGRDISMSFMTCSGLSMTVDTIPYREGGYNITTQKMPGQADFGPLTFTKGVAIAQVGGSAGVDEMNSWMGQIFTVMQGTGSTSDTTDFRRNVEIMVLDHPVTAANAAVKAEFTVFRAWPTSLAYSDLDAGANQLFIAQMTLAHEGFTPHLATSAGAADAVYSSTT